MRWPRSPHVTALGDEIVTGIEGDDRRRWRWSVHGPPASGKKSLLSYVAETLRAQNRRVVYLAPPLGERDSGMVAASQLSLALDDELDGTQLSEALHDPALSWSAKVTLLAEALDEVRREVVILASEPDAWASTRRGGQTDATTVATLVQSLGLRCVTTTSRRLDPAPDRTVRECRWGSVYERWFEADWAPAQRLPELGRLMPESSPSLVRLLAAYADLTSDRDAYDLVRQAQSRGHALPRSVFAALSREHAEVARTWCFVALLRTPFDEALLTALSAPSASSDAGRLLREALLTRAPDGRFLLNDLLRHAVPPESVLDRAEIREARLVISAYYLDLAERERWPAFHIEAFHQAAAALDVEAVCRVRRHFAEQPWLFADRLFEARRPAEAGRYLDLVYDAASTPGGSGSGAGGGHAAPASAEYHHRRAFAADAACDADVAERHYRQALAIDARDPQLHSRFICFLLDLGRTREARSAWEDADAALPSAEDLDSDQLQALHAQVAWRLVRAHDLEFAELVLGEVPPERIDELPSLRTVQGRLRSLRLAQRHGPVLPFGLLTEGWWLRVPPELPGTLDGRPLRLWWAGRVSAVEPGEGAVVDVAEVEAGRQEPPTPGESEHTFEELHAAGLDNAEALTPGSFLVAGFYGDDLRMAVRAVTAPDTRVGLPRPELDPQRYLKLHGLAA